MEKIADRYDLMGIAQDYLKLHDSEFLLRYSIDKAAFAKELDDDESLADKFSEILDKSFTRKMQRDCYVTISKLVEEIHDGGEVNEQRVAQQSLQTLMALKKSLGEVKSRDKKDYLSVLEELE